ncbi:ABC transporter substrate-binding protein [Gracilibacillus massiliensis]|uniref:ABC transporter substrate-binding protein n=1 Tax=Gracilibacillus massiliensis TaxID=1564956 RepID=UPI00071E63FC|nr:sugar ABC transporter substrate-binding protein [Gracilibacillus massiliensis]
MKKLLFILLFSLLTFVACSSSENEAESDDTTETESSEEKVTLSFLSWDGEEAMNPVIEGFEEAHPEIEIEFSHAPPVEGYISNLQTRLLSDSAADVFIMAAENRNDLIQGDYVVDLTDEAFMEPISEANKAAYSQDGKTYALSVSSWGGGAFYNKKIFEEAGIDPKPQTWEEFIEIGKQLEEFGVTPFYDTFQSEIPGSLSALSGAEIISDNPDYDTQLFNGETTFSDEWTSVLETYNQLFTEGIVKEAALGLNGDQILSEFINENVAMLMTGPWNINAIEEGNPDLEFGVMPIPGTEEGTLFASGAASPGYAINKSTENMEAAKTFLEYLSSPEGLELIYEGTGAFITADGYEAETHPSLELISEALLDNRYYLPQISWPRHNNELSQEFIVGIQDMIMGNSTPEDITNRLDQRLNELEGN